jgi:hypothetical protein
MTLTYAGTLDRSAFLRATDVVADLISSPAVSEAWAAESTCAGMTVGGLVRHLTDQPAVVVEFVGADPARTAEAETISVLDHFARAEWMHEDLDGGSHQFLRGKANYDAAEGPDAAVSYLNQAREALPAVLANAADVTYIDWESWNLATDDWLVTRLMEMVVHADDLAASVGLPPPTFEVDVIDSVIGLLAALAVRRHGQSSVVRTLARPQRAPAGVSVF